MRPGLYWMMLITLAAMMWLEAIKVDTYFICITVLISVSELMDYLKDNNNKEEEEDD